VCTFSCNSKLRTPIPDGQRSTLNGDFPIGISPLAMSTTLTFPNPECRGADSPMLPVLHSTSWGPTLPRHLGISRIADPRCKFPLHCENPERRTPTLPGISCHLSLSDRRLPIKSGNRDSRFQRACNSCLANRRMPICDGLNGFFAPAVNSLATSPDLTVSGISRFSTAISSRRFSSS
jgi:hypothetical protein